MQVNIKTIPMKQIAEDMAQIRRKINTCEMELAQIRKELAELELSNVEEPLGRILQCEKACTFCAVLHPVWDGSRTDMLPV